MTVRVGVDTGGTFTDAVAATEDGRLVVGKALSTPQQVEQGVLDALAQVAEKLGQDLPAMLADTEVLAHGTTVGLNTLITRRGARVGLITTKGFESTLAIAKANKLHGLDLEDMRVPVRWDKPHQLIDRRMVVGVAERVDATGEIVEKLDEGSVITALEALQARGATSIAVSLLWSVVNPVHEIRVGELVRQVLPDAHVTLSSELAPRLGEYERTSTVVLDAYIAPLVSSYLERLQGELSDRGFKGLLVVMRMGGGVQSIETARRAPVQTLQSGPAGGVAASQKLGEALGRPNVIATDVGGTSFEVGLVIDGEPEYTRQPMVDRHALSIPAVDITSIGTGGGSIAWHDTVLGSLRVGPASAGSSPGPACYARGGTEPTVTDAAVALGYVDRLGRSLVLDRPAALAAIEERIARPLGLTVHEAADGIIRVACEQMRDLIRRTTIQRGHDPSDFTLFVYGGAGPQYAGRYAEGLGVAEVVVPMLAAEFSAFGAIASDLRAVGERDVRPVPLGADLGLLTDALDEIAESVRAELSWVGGGEPKIRRSIGLRFYRQVHRIDVAVPDGPIDGAAADADFRRRYERIVGPGSANANTPVEVVAVAAEAYRPVPFVRPQQRPATVGDPVGSRQAWFGGTEMGVPIFRWSDLGAEQVIDGPAFVDAETTTVVVWGGQRARVDASGDIRIELSSSEKGGEGA